MAQVLGLTRFWQVIPVRLLFFVFFMLSSFLSLTAVAQQAQVPRQGTEQRGAPPMPAQILQPKPEKLERPTVWGEPTEVQVAIYVIDVDNVDSANENFSASIYYEARWQNPLLQHVGPGPLIEPATSVWTPRLTIVNQQQAWNAFSSFVEISPAGEVVYRQKTWGWFSQPLDLHDFPLDQQVLTIHLVAAGLMGSEVKMVALSRGHGRRSGISSAFSLPDFSVVSWKAEAEPYLPYEGEVGVAGYMLQLKIQRNAAYFFWKMVLPLCMIVIMSWVPRWINPEEIGTNISVSTTSFLTLVAYLFAITVLLPRVAYFTRMDLFILLSTLIVFIGLIQTVLVSVLVGRVTPRRIAISNSWSRIVYPLALVCVLGISFRM